MERGALQLDDRRGAHRAQRPREKLRHWPGRNQVDRQRQQTEALRPFLDLGPTLQLGRNKYLVDIREARVGNSLRYDVVPIRGMRTVRSEHEMTLYPEAMRKELLLKVGGWRILANQDDRAAEPFSARQPGFEGCTQKRPMNDQTRETDRGERNDRAARKGVPALQRENASSQEHKDADPGERHGSDLGGPGQ